MQWPDIFYPAFFFFGNFLTIISFKLPTVFFRELEQMISQVVWKYKKPE